MSNLIKALQFYDNGKNKREKENFQGFLFSNIDMKKRETPISFYRSDFRGAKFQEINFYKNDFSNSDIIDGSLLNSSFENCQFRFAEIYNSYFENISFVNTLFKSTSLIKLIFKSCEFSELKFVEDTIRECKFLDCLFYNIIFEKNSIDEVEFVNSKFKDVDLSNMTAINLFFNNCDFDNVIIDPDYLGSYFFKEKFLDNLKFKYRGKIFKLDIGQTDLLNNLFKMLFEKERYYEALNIIIQKNLLERKQSSIFSVLKIIIERLVKEKNSLKRTYQFERIFKMFEYYLNTGYISIDDYFKSIGYFEKLNIQHFDFYEQLTFAEKVNRLKVILEKVDLEFTFIESAEPTRKILLEIKINETDKRQFEKFFTNTMKKIAHKLSISTVPYKIINLRKGSIIYDILIYSSAALLFLKMLKSSVKISRETLHEAMQFRIDYQLNSKVFEYTKKIKGKTQMNKLNSVKEFQNNSKSPLNQVSSSEKEDIKELASLIESIKIYPNALPKGKD